MSASTSPIFLLFSLSVVGAACGDDAITGGAGGAGAGPTTNNGGTSNGGGPIGGSGGAPTSCGDGQVDAGEECDEGAATASCDEDCTAVSCGDGSHNPLAGEQCDDGNTAEGDVCSAACAPTVVVLTPSFPANPSQSIAVAWTGDPFSLVWTVNGTTTTDLSFATIGASGVSLQAPLQTVTAGNVTIGSGPAGRGMIISYDCQPPTCDLGWRFVSPGGTLEAGQGSEADGGFALSGYPAGKPFATASGLFCGLGFNGTLRCADDTTAFSSTVVSPGGAVDSAQMIARGEGLFVNFITEGNPYQIRTLELDSAGAPVGAVDIIASTDDDGFASGGLLRPDGSFGFAVSSGGEVTWYPFHADGVFDETNVSSIGTSQVRRAKLAAIPSGRFILVWYELQNGPQGDSCSLVGRLFDEQVQPLGSSFVLYEAPEATCAARFDVASSPTGDVALAWLDYVQGGTFVARALYLPSFIPDSP